MKKQFLQTLAQYLDVLNEEERNEILAFYEERFSTGMRYEGKGEAEIIDELESPQQIARHVLEEYGFDAQRVMQARKRKKPKQSGVSNIIGIVLFDIFLVAIIVGALSSLTVALVGGLFAYITRLFATVSLAEGMGILALLGGLGLAFFWLLLVLALYDVFIGFIAWLVRWHAAVFKIGSPRHVYRSIRRLRIGEYIKKNPLLQRTRSIVTLLALVFIVIGSIASIAQIGALPGFDRRTTLETHVYDYDMAEMIGNDEVWSIDGLLEIGRVRIVSSQSETLLIRSEEREDTPLSVTFDSDTNTIRLKNSYDRFLFINIFGFFQLPEVIIEVPEALMLDAVDVTTTNGSMRMKGLVAEEVSFQTSNGTIALEAVTANSVFMKSTNGKLTATDVDASSLTMQSSNGAIELVAVNAKDATLETSNGAITIEAMNVALQDGETLVARTSNGKITIEDVYTLDVLLRTSNGDIEYHNNDLGFQLNDLETRTSNGDVYQNVFRD